MTAQEVEGVSGEMLVVPEPGDGAEDGEQGEEGEGGDEGAEEVATAEEGEGEEHLGKVVDLEMGV